MTEYTLFSRLNDVIEQFDIDDDDDVIEHLENHLSNDIYVDEWFYNYYANIWYGTGKNIYDREEIDYYILCDAENTMHDTYNNIIEQMKNTEE